MEHVLRVDEKGELQITAEALQIKELKEIWMSDRSNGKREAKKKLSLIYFYGSRSRQNPYSDVPESKRINTIMEDLDIKSVDKQVYDGIERYEDLRKKNNIVIPFIEQALTALDKMQDYFKNIDLFETDDNGKLVYSAKDYFANFEKMDKLFDTYKNLRDKLENYLEEEQKQKSSNYGNSVPGIIESEEGF